MVQSYVELARAERQAGIAQRTIATRQQSLGLVEVRERNRLASRIDITAAQTLVSQAQLALVQEQVALARDGGGQTYRDRHHARGKLLARERIELLLDRDSPFLELMPVAAYGSTFPVGASVVCGIGVVEGVEVLVIANDPTVRGGASNPYSSKKVGRAMEVARENRLPIIVFNIHEPGAFTAVMKGEGRFTTVMEQERAPQ